MRWWLSDAGSGEAFRAKGRERLALGNSHPTAGQRACGSLEDQSVQKVWRKVAAERIGEGKDNVVGDLFLESTLTVRMLRSRTVSRTTARLEQVLDR